MYKRKDIVFSSKKGYYFNDTTANYFYGFYCLLFIMFIFISILALIYKDKDIIQCAFLSLFINLIVFFISLPLLLKEWKMPKHLKNCLKDCVKLKANIKCYEAFYKHKIYVIKFIYNGKNIEYKSNIVKITYFNKSIFNKFIGKKINILYSPSMEDVLFLKQQNN